MPMLNSLKFRCDVKALVAAAEKSLEIRDIVVENGADAEGLIKTLLAQMGDFGVGNVRCQLKEDSVLVQLDDDGTYSGQDFIRCARKLQKLINHQDA